MWKKISIILIFLWLTTISFLSYKFIKGNSVVVDKRIAVRLSEGDRDLILGEMRILLKGVRGIIKGLSEDDFKVVELAARTNGMIMAQDVNPALMLKLPKDFKLMGMSVHKDFDQLAENIPKLSQKQILHNLNQIMNKCVVCHETYKFTTTHD